MHNICRIAVAVSGMLLFHSCLTTPPPTPEVNLEEYDSLRIAFVKLDTAGQQTADTTAINFDKSGRPVPAQIMLTSGATYRMLLTLFSNAISVNNEIIAEGTLHRFFFLPSANGYLSYVYADTDARGQGIGLDGKMTVLQSGSPFTLAVILRHGLDKTLPGAATWNSIHYETAGGEDDLSVLLGINPQ